MKVKINYKGKKIEVRVRELSHFGMFRGLMFKNSETENLLFDFGHDNRNSIHSIFVFFDFFVVWIDSENNVVEFEIIKPYRFNVIPKKNFRKLLELPLNNKNKKILRFFVGKGKI